MYQSQEVRAGCGAKIGCGSDPFVWLAAAAARRFRVAAEVGSFLFAVLNAEAEDERKGVAEICGQLRRR
jgi:hypothetical protein